MKKILSFVVIFLLVQQLSAQFRYDNKLYQTIFWEDLCKTLAQQKDYLLLDVRSPGEFSDTSTMASMNIGHLKGAMNIDIRQLPDNLQKLDAYKDKTIYVYCSHSQRSRRASKLLSEKGFKKVININGGMTVLNLTKDQNFPCSQNLYQTNDSYQLISPVEMCSLLSNEKDIYVLDVRKDSSFKSISDMELINAYGRFKNSVNIPFENLSASLNQIPQNKKIIIVDDFGNESAIAAALLAEKGYKNVRVLFNGLDEWNSMDPAELPCKSVFVENNNAYRLITPEEFSKMSSQKDMLILDVRSDSDYHNISKSYWRNVGNVKQAVNIPAEQLKDKINSLNQFKDKPVVVYSFSTAPESFSSAKLLSEKGFTKVYVLMNGIFGIRWRANNIKDHAYLTDLIENVPADNL
jgi:rhodanese-related sulfurtransferase